MILLKTTTEIDQKLLDEGRVRIAVDLGFDEVLVTVERDAETLNYIGGHVSRYQIALGMEW